jgi:hypothetical protein
MLVSSKSVLHGRSLRRPNRMARGVLIQGLEAMARRARLMAHETESIKTLTGDGDAPNKKERESSPT